LDLENYILDVFRRFSEANIYFGHGTDNAYDEAVYLVFGILGIDVNADIQLVNRVLQEFELEYLEVNVKHRIKDHIPVAYLAGETYFAGFKFFSDRRALIPRSPIAELIMNKFQPLLKDTPRRILDLCTGSGCIGIAIANYFENSEIDISDNNKDCLQLAAKNIDLYDLSGRVHLIHSNLFDDITDKYDLIVCNPPYISKEEYDALPIEYLHEPRTSLISDDFGLAIPRKILHGSAEYLTETGLLIMEVGFSDSELIKYYPDAPFLWLEFDRGGRGVFALTAGQLVEFFKELN